MRGGGGGGGIHAPPDNFENHVSQIWLQMHLPYNICSIILLSMDVVIFAFLSPYLQYR
jgi:hypothetical protein